MATKQLRPKSLQEQSQENKKIQNKTPKPKSIKQQEQDKKRWKDGESLASMASEKGPDLNTESLLSMSSQAPMKSAKTESLISLSNPRTPVKAPSKQNQGGQQEPEY